MANINPTTPNNFMVAAAEKALSDLQNKADYATDAAARAEDSAARAESMASRWKKLTIGVLALVIIVAGLGAWMFFGLRQQAVNSCKIGNDRATGTIVSMDELIKVLEGPKPKPQIVSLANNLENYIASHNQQRNCSSVYRVIP